jgi:hypothetical protein
MALSSKLLLLRNYRAKVGCKMESTMNSGTAKIVTEYPELGKLYHVHPWNIVHAPLGFIVPGRKQESSTLWVDRDPSIVLSCYFGNPD